MPTLIVQLLIKLSVLRGRGGSGGKVKEVPTPPPPPEITSGFLIQLVFCKKEKKPCAQPPKKNLGSTLKGCICCGSILSLVQILFS